MDYERQRPQLILMMGVVISMFVDMTTVPRIAPKIVGLTSCLFIALWSTVAVATTFATARAAGGSKKNYCRLSGMATMNLFLVINAILLLINTMIEFEPAGFLNAIAVACEFMFCTGLQIAISIYCKRLNIHFQIKPKRQ